MREHVSQSKKATTASFSIPSLKHRIPGFGLDSSQASPQAVPLVQPLHKPLTHDISRIPLRNPQAKLSISQPGDKYEQEADSVAQQVMQRIAQPVNRQSIQPEAMPEEEQLQMKPMANSITPLVQRQEMPEDEEELQMKSLDNSTLQRQQAPEDESELQMKPMVQRRAEARMADAPDLEASINQARGGGQAMAKNIRHPMEQAFGTDFSGVKVHTDGQSDQLNRSIQARAFTTGQDVFFRQGEYNPGSRGGQELLAHELTHVVQQNKSAGQPIQRLEETLDNAVWSDNKLYVTNFGGNKEKLGSDDDNLPSLPGVTWTADGDATHPDGDNLQLHKPQTTEAQDIFVPRDCITTAELVSAWLLQQDPENIGSVRIPPTVKPAKKSTSVEPGDILLHIHSKKAGDFHGVAVVAKDGNDVVTMEADRSLGNKIGKMKPIFDMYAGHVGFKEDQTEDGEVEKTYVIHLADVNGRVTPEVESLWKGIQDEIDKKGYFKTGVDAANYIKNAIAAELSQMDVDSKSD